MLKAGILIVFKKDNRFRANKLDCLWEILGFTQKNIDVMFVSISEISRLLFQVENKIKRKNSEQREFETIA